VLYHQKMNCWSLPHRRNLSWMSCRLCGLDPEAYLRHVFERIAEHPINKIEELLLWNIASQLGSAIGLAA